MSFSNDIKKFAINARDKIKEMEDEQKRKIAAFLKDKLGEEAKLVASIKFDNEKLKFYDVEAPESVIAKLRKAGYLRE
jgi:hypothetical protein